ncbi:hypothetical protein Efla_002511 [Eimeria flavescens]
MAQGWSGSTLEGLRINGWLEGDARCVLPGGVVYVGQFKGGNFHGKGALLYPAAGVYEAEWEEGRAVRGRFVFSDGLYYQTQQWSYLAASDRRMGEELSRGFDAQRSTRRHPPTETPQEMYDTGNGLFNRKTGEIRSCDGRSVDETPNALLASWIVSHCRRGTADPSKIA